jgi:flavin reductase (DIM6/NTAB) family NADH-FMN oxidoreductase RutF
MAVVMAIVKEEELRQAMRRWTTGVTIVTAESRGIQHGMTVSSFTSVSLDPPTVSISLEQNSRTHELISEAGSFGITFLSSEQQPISERFAGKFSDDMDRFAGLDTWRIISGAPFLVGGLAFLDCQVHSIHQFGSNSLIIGEILAAKSGENRDPLLYYNRQYRRLQE